MASLSKDLTLCHTMGRKSTTKFVESKGLAAGRWWLVFDRCLSNSGTLVLRLRPRLNESFPVRSGWVENRITKHRGRTRCI